MCGNHVIVSYKTRGVSGYSIVSCMDRHKYRILDTILVHYAPYIALVCGFARGEAECKTTNECNIRRIMHKYGIQYLTCCTLETSF